MDDINPKIDYCLKKQQPSTSSKTIATCSSVQYNKINTGGNDPSISCRMLYAQTARNSSYKTGVLSNNT
jgi:hypothetical protein